MRLLKVVCASLALYSAVAAHNAVDPSTQADNTGLAQPIMAAGIENTATGSPSFVENRSDSVELSKRTSVADLPFQVVLSFRNSGSTWDSGGCQGSLIAPNIVLTTASCLMNSTFELYPVSQFYAALSYEYNTSNGIVYYYEAYKLYPHPDFTPTNTTANIGLIALKQSIPSSRAIPAEIYDQDISDSLKVQTPVIRYPSGIGSRLSDLAYIDVEISNSTLCGIANPQWFENNNSSICAVNTGGKGYCFYNTGGALVTVGNNTQKLVGIFNRLVSTLPFPYYSCDRNDTLSYYTPLKDYTGWIDEQRKAIDALPEAPANTTVIVSQNLTNSSPSKLTVFKTTLSALKLISITAVSMAVACV